MTSINHDGTPDVWISSYSNLTTKDASGSARLYDGPFDGVRPATDFLVRVNGMGGGDMAGAGLANIGDADADGIDDIAIAAPGVDMLPGYDVGAVYPVLSAP